MSPGTVIDLPSAEADITPVVPCLSDLDREASMADVYIVVGKLIAEHEKFYHPRRPPNRILARIRNYLAGLRCHE